MKTALLLIALAIACLTATPAQAQYNPLTYLQQVEASLATAHPAGATAEQRIAALEAKLAEAQADRIAYRTRKDALELQLFEAKNLAAKSAAQPAPATAYTPIPTNAQLYNQIRGGPASGTSSSTTTKPQITQVIQTGVGTATVINPDGSHSYIQRTGAGHAQIITPARK